MREKGIFIHLSLNNHAIGVHSLDFTFFMSQFLSFFTNFFSNLSVFYIFWSPSEQGEVCWENHSLLHLLLLKCQYLPCLAEVLVSRPEFRVKKFCLDERM